MAHETENWIAKKCLLQKPMQVPVWHCEKLVTPPGDGFPHVYHPMPPGNCFQNASLDESATGFWMSSTKNSEVTKASQEYLQVILAAFLVPSRHFHQPWNKLEFGGKAPSHSLLCLWHIRAWEESHQTFLLSRMNQTADMFCRLFGNTAGKFCAVSSAKALFILEGIPWVCVWRFMCVATCLMCLFRF